MHNVTQELELLAHVNKSVQRKLNISLATVFSQIDRKLTVKLHFCLIRVILTIIIEATMQEFPVWSAIFRNACKIEFLPLH